MIMASGVVPFRLQCQFCVNVAVAEALVAALQLWVFGTLAHVKVSECVFATTEQNDRCSPWRRFVATSSTHPAVWRMKMQLQQPVMAHMVVVISVRFVELSSAVCGQVRWLYIFDALCVHFYHALQVSVPLCKPRMQHA